MLLCWLRFFSNLLMMSKIMLNLLLSQIHSPLTQARHTHVVLNAFRIKILLRDKHRAPPKTLCDMCTVSECLQKNNIFFVWSFGFFLDTALAKTSLVEWQQTTVLMPKGQLLLNTQTHLGEMTVLTFCHLKDSLSWNTLSKKNTVKNSFSSKICALYLVSRYIPIE